MKNKYLSFHLSLPMFSLFFHRFTPSIDRGRERMRKRKKRGGKCCWVLGDGWDLICRCWGRTPVSLFSNSLARGNAILARIVTIVIGQTKLTLAHVVVMITTCSSSQRAGVILLAGFSERVQVSLSFLGCISPSCLSWLIAPGIFVLWEDSHVWVMELVHLGVLKSRCAFSMPWFGFVICVWPPVDLFSDP